MAIPQTAMAQPGSSDAIVSNMPRASSELERVERCDGRVESSLDLFGAGRLEPHIPHDVSGFRGVGRLFNVACIPA